MEFLITYDVSTTESAGQKRLRKLAQVCEAYGQRVQKSVFECTLSPAQKELFVHEASKIIDGDEDSLRIYRLQQPREENLDVFGKPLLLDFHDTLLV